jgi:hypothetical protein
VAGIQSMIIPMQILGELENAIDTCSSCLGPNCASINSLYKAVAYYTGSTEKTSLFQLGSPTQDLFDATGSEISLYNLADFQCSTFGTCGPSTTLFSETSNVNLEIIAAFEAMRIGLISNCGDAIAQKKIVANNMLIPLIQNMFYFLHLSQDRRINELPNGLFMTSLTRATSVLPLIHYCNSTSANMILQNFVGQGNIPSFSIVKTAIEENYECLGITTAEVGTYSNDN